MTETWHRYPEEKPSKSGWYKVAAAYGNEKPFEATDYYDAVKDEWDYHRSASHVVAWTKRLSGEN